MRVYSFVRFFPVSSRPYTQGCTNEGEPAKGKKKTGGAGIMDAFVAFLITLFRTKGRRRDHSLLVSCSLVFVRLSCAKQNDSAMCMKVDCSKCEKPTWKGCGKHIEEALKDVPEDERCKCPRDPPAVAAATTEKTVVKETEECKVETKVEVKSDDKAAATTTEVVKEEPKAKAD